MGAHYVLRLLAFVALAGCGGLAGAPATDDAGVRRDAEGAPRTPSQHRTQGSSCAPAPVPPEPEIPDAGLSPSARFECKLHADCVAHPRGRCLFVPTNIPIDPGGTRCVYDACKHDTDCADGESCACGSLANTCLSGDCRLDGDCGSGGFCSPTVDPCGAGITGYFCHTQADTCVDDRDCAQTTFASHCLYDASAKHWGCSPIGCASAAQ